MTQEEANEALQEALSICDVEGMKNALRFGADVNMWLDCESVPLVAAAGKCYRPSKAARAAEMVALLLATPGIEVNKPDGAGCTALLVASDTGCVDIVAQLLAVPGIDVNKADEEGFSPLAAAIYRGFTEVIALLEAAGASPVKYIPNLLSARKRIIDEVDEALLNAAGEGDVEAVKTALAAGANVSAIGFCAPSYGDGDGYGAATPLFFAAEKGSSECVALLLAAGADVDAREATEITPLMVASGGGHVDCMRLLLDAGADVAAADESGWTALFFAARYNGVDGFPILIEAGAKMDATDYTGMTPLFAAAGGGAADFVSLLLAAGADVNARNEEGGSALHYATEYPECVKLLIEAGADVNAVTKDPNEPLSTPLKWAYSYDCQESVALLKAAGAVDVVASPRNDDAEYDTEDDDSDEEDFGEPAHV